MLLQNKSIWYHDKHAIMPSLQNLTIQRWLVNNDEWDLDGKFYFSINLPESWLPRERIWAWAPLPSWWNQTSLHILCKHYPLPSLRESSLNPWLSVSSDLLLLNQSVYLKIKSKYVVRQRPVFLFAKLYYSKSLLIQLKVKHI